MKSCGPTPFRELNEVLARLVAGIIEILGPNLVGVYLQGSFAVGDFDEHSDLDFIVLIESDLTALNVDLLNELHLKSYNLNFEWAKHLEGSYFPRHILTEEPGQPVWYLDHGHTTLERSAHCNTHVVRWILVHHGIALHGPPASAVYLHVSDDALRTEILQTLLGWGQEILNNPKGYANRFYQGFIVLSYCRMLQDLEQGIVSSKKAGADWAKANLPVEWHGLIDRAWSCRPNPALSVKAPANAEDFAATLDFVRFTTELARQAYGRLARPADTLLYTSLERDV